MLVKHIDKYGIWLIYLYAIAANISPGAASVAVFSSIPLMLMKLLNKDIVFTDMQKQISQGIFVFVIAIAITSIFSFNPPASFNKLASYATRFLPFFMAVFFIKNRTQLINVCFLLLLSILVADFYCLWQKYNNYQRVVGFDHNAIYFANQLLLTMIIGIVLIFSGLTTKKTRWFYGFTVILSTVILLFNKTRGVWIAFVCVLALYALFTRKKNPYIIPAAGVFLVLSLGAVLLIPEFYARALSIFDTDNSSNTERVWMMMSAWSMFLDYPLTGVGLAQFQNFYMEGGKYLLPFAKLSGFAHPHNSFMTFLAEGGIIGFAAFICLFYFPLRELVKKLSSTDDTPLAVLGILAIAGFLIGGMTDHTFTMMNVLRLLWFIIGISTYQELNPVSHNAK